MKWRETYSSILQVERERKTPTWSVVDFILGADRQLQCLVRNVATVHLGQVISERVAHCV